MSNKVPIMIWLACLALIHSGPAQAQSDINAGEAAARFSDEVSTFIAHLDVETEDFSIRINRCVGRQGEVSDRIFYVWIGWRGLAGDETASDQLSAVRSRWLADDWKISRDRALENGGINVAAIEPGTGNAYSLDSGFEAGPQSYIVGFFNTPCFANPDGSAPFGVWRAP
jgi:hypothetical protein